MNGPSKLESLLASGRLFQPSLMFASKTRDYPQLLQFNIGPVFLANVSLGCKSPPGTNTLTYQSIRKKNKLLIEQAMEKIKSFLNLNESDFHL
jgi:hypothetical protein